MFSQITWVFEPGEEIITIILLSVLIMVAIHSVPFQIQVKVSPKVVPSGQSKSTSSPGSPCGPSGPSGPSIPCDPCGPSTPVSP